MNGSRPDSALATRSWWVRLGTSQVTVLAWWPGLGLIWSVGMQRVRLSELMGLGVCLAVLGVVDAVVPPASDGDAHRQESGDDAAAR